VLSDCPACRAPAIRGNVTSDRQWPKNNPPTSKHEARLPDFSLRLLASPRNVCGADAVPEIAATVGVRSYITLHTCRVTARLLSGRTDNDDTRHGLVPERSDQPDALTRVRRRLLTAHPDPTRANTPTPGSLTDEQLRVLAAHDWAPPRIGALEANTLTTADLITRVLLAELVREALERRLGAERPMAPTTTRVQDTTHSAGESSTTMTTATTTSREPPSASPTRAS